MKILGIETSCDETSSAVIEDGRKIFSNTVSSSKDMHQKTGGIIPEMAAREQIKCIIPVLNRAIDELGKKVKEKNDLGMNLPVNLISRHIDAIAVTIGPGLLGSLLVGVEAAKTISMITGKPLIPVNHIFAHIYANWLTNPGWNKNKNYILPSFPALALVASGGHTELFYLKDHGRIRWLGGTLDDASGEAFDKTARLLGLGYPGGPEIACQAEKFEIRNSKFEIHLPRPMINSRNLNFSFSGLKTAVMREVNMLKNKNQFNSQTIKQLAHEIQESITDILVKKTLDAADKYKTKSILLGGGVTANIRLKEKFKLEIDNRKLKIDFHAPPSSLCTDNAAYIASYAYFNYKPVFWKDIQAVPDLEIEV